jgi:broad specificity phosphatase PhoE
LLDRTTATPLAETPGVPNQIADDISDINYGEWTGRAAADLESDPPGGEDMLLAESICRIHGWRIPLSA